MSEYATCINQAQRELKAGNLGRGRDWLLKAAREKLILAQSLTGCMRDMYLQEAGELRSKAMSLSVAQQNHFQVLAQKSTEKKQESADAGQQAGGERWRVKNPKISFDEIAGLKEVKQLIINKGIDPLRYPESSKKFKQELGGGVLLYGPPGTGKTMLAKGVATELNAPFFSLSSSNILSKWVGEAEKNVKDLFDAARSYPIAVIFIDEAEALIPKRSVNSTVMKRVVPEFLKQWDGIDNNDGALLVVGATNRPADLDEAATRPGRFENLVYVGLPEAEVREVMCRMYLDSIPGAEHIDLSVIVEKTEGYSGADIKALVKRACTYPWRREIDTRTGAVLTMEDMMNALELQKKSVTKKSIEMCEKFQQERSN